MSELEGLSDLATAVFEAPSQERTTS